MTKSEILSKLIEVLDRGAGGRNIYIVASLSRARLNDVFLEIKKTIDLKQISNETLSINSDLIHYLETNNILENLLQKEKDKKNETLKNEMQKVIKILISNKINHASILLIKDIELSLAFEFELAYLRQMAINEKRAILFVEGQIKDDVVYLYKKGSIMLPSSIIMKQWCWQLE